MTTLGNRYRLARKYGGDLLLIPLSQVTPYLGGAHFRG